MANKLKWSGSADLKLLLNHSRVCESSAPRDKVYAFIGLAHSGHGVVPDYSTSNSVSAVFTATAEEIILRENSLDLLTLCSVVTSRKGVISLPTRVPNWTVETHTDTTVTLLARKMAWESSLLPSYWRLVPVSVTSDITSNSRTLNTSDVFLGRLQAPAYHRDIFELGGWP